MRTQEEDPTNTPLHKHRSLLHQSGKTFSNIDPILVHLGRNLQKTLVVEANLKILMGVTMESGVPIKAPMESGVADDKDLSLQMQLALLRYSNDKCQSYYTVHCGG